MSHLRPKRIVFYSNCLGRGGAHQSFLAWVDLLKEEPGIELLVYCHEDGWMAGELRARGVAVKILPMPSGLAQIRHGQWKNRWNTFRRGLSIVGRLVFTWVRLLFVRADALVLTGGRDFIMLLPLAVRLRHRSATVPQTTDWGEIPTCRTMCRLAAKTFAISGEVAETIVEMGVSRSKIKVLPLIFTADFAHLYGNAAGLRRTLGLPNNRLILGMTGVVRPHKGQLDAVVVLHHVIAQGLPAHLVIVGAPPADAPESVAYFAEVHKTVERLGLSDHVTFAGWQSDIAKWMRCFDVLLVPSHDFEGVPRVILEGLEAGLPVFGSDLPQFKEVLLQRGTGVLHPVKDHQAWAQAIVDLWENAETFKRAGQKARKVWEQNYSHEAVRTQLIPEFRRLANA